MPKTAAECVRTAVVAALAFLALSAAVPAAAQLPAQVDFAAPYVPTAPSVVERMLQLARVGPDDFLIDLGSGDGRIVITAATKFGARGFGVDIDADLVKQSNENARAAGVGDRARFYERDLFATDLSPATVITIYLLSMSTIKLRDKLFSLKPGTRIVSHAGSLGEWKADRFEMLDVKDKVREDAPSKTYIYYWVVPARVEGVWRWSLPDGARTQNYELAASQRFQMLSGSLQLNGKDAGRAEGRLDGERISLAFTAAAGGKPLEHRLVGRIVGDSIVGTATLGDRPPHEWKATRASSAPSAKGRPGSSPR